MAPRNEDMVEVKLILTNHLEYLYGCKTLPLKMLIESEKVNIVNKFGFYCK